MWKTLYEIDSKPKVLNAGFFNFKFTYLLIEG